MGRAETDVRKINGFRFVMEYDFGGDPRVPYTCWIYKKSDNNNGYLPMEYKNGGQVRREFKSNYNKTHYNNFINKFANDEIYRNDYIINERNK